MSEILTGGPLKFTEPNCSTRVGEIIETLSEIYDIPMPRLGMSVYVKDEGVNYTITKLEPKLIEGVLVPDAKVAEYELQTGKSIAWNSSSNINDYVVAGVYNITGERLNVNDGLPIANSNPGHTISARLVVLDSSITGTGDSQDKCITQVLTLSNRTGEDGNMYIRTGHGGNINSLSWEPWKTLQTNINVDTVDNLDNLKDNGIYSGVWTKGSYNNSPLTFVCIVINDYIVGTAPRRISQFVYGLSKSDGSTVYQTRVWDDSKNAWGDWEILNQKEISSMISDEIKKVTDGVDPEKLDSLKDLIAWVDTHGGEVAKIKSDIQANEVAIETEFIRAMEAEGTLANNLAEAEKNIANQLFATPGTDKVTIIGRNEQSMRLNFQADIPAATTEKAGIMTAADKMKLNNLAVENTNTDLNTYFHEGVYLFRHTLLTNAPIPSDSVVSARLTVLTAYDGKSSVITQVLNLNNLSGGEGNIYIRSHQNDSWKPWGKLQTNVEVEQIVKEEENRAKEAEEKLEEKIANEKTALVNGDIIVGQAREVYSRTGKVDTTTFLKRTTAGGTSISDGVATLKQIGGNILKNNLDIESIVPKFITMENRHGVIVVQPQSDGEVHGNVQLFVDSNSYIDGHVYYTSFILKSNVQSAIAAYAGTGYNAARRIVGGTIMPDVWTNISGVSTFVSGDIANLPKLALFPFGTTGTTSVNNRLEIFSMLSVDLTEMYGAGNEPSKEECDRMFACMGALPQGLTIAQPTGLKSIGYNQWNPANVLNNKGIVENAIEDDVADRHIAIVECLPCKTGTGENNGYVIGYGEGDTWSDEGIEVYLTPLNPLEVDGELYLQKLDKEATYGTYVPQIKGYLLVVTPTTDKLCAHFHWSGDRATTDYEPYVESSVALPVIPEMSEWGLAGIQASGIQDSVNLENNTYTKRIDCLDLGNISYQYYSPSETYPYGFFATSIMNARFSKTNALMCEKYTHGSFAVDKAIMANTANNGTFYIIDGSYTDVVSLKNALEGVKLYYEIIPQEYPIVTKAAPNYIGSDYGVEEFTGSKVPLAANILFYMRSLVSETRNFLDRLMARLGMSDATAVADKIADAIIPTDVEPTEVVEE